MDERGATRSFESSSEPDAEAAARDVVRVLVVHPYAILRGGLIATLEADPRLRAVGQLAGSQAAGRLLEQGQADVVLVGESLWRDRTEELAGARVVVLTASRRAAHLGRILAAGAEGCVSLTADLPRLREAVHVVAAGGRYVADGVHDPVVRLDDDPDGGWPDDPGGIPPEADAAYGLTPAELRVLGGLVDGLTNGQIADARNVSENTVKSQVGAILRKLDVSGRAHATAVAIREGLVT